MVFHRDTPFLRPAIAGVLGQTLADLELILVDNGTALPAAALGPAAADPRVRWVRLPTNEGIPAGHNAGVAAARGEFVALHDYDDVSVPHRLERQVAALRAAPQVALVSGLAVTIDATDRTTGKVFCVPAAGAHRAYAQFAAPIVTPAAMARREWLASLPYRAAFPFAADLDFQARASETARFAVLPEVLLRYRVYAAQTTQDQADLIERSRAAINLATARRRAGRPEDIAATVDRLAVGGPDQSCGAAAERAAEEGFPVLAAYYARRALMLARSAGLRWRALRIAARAARVGRSEALRMFLTGPVRTLGVRPA